MIRKSSWLRFQRINWLLKIIKMIYTLWDTCRIRYCQHAHHLNGNIVYSLSCLLSSSYRITIINRTEIFHLIMISRVHCEVDILWVKTQSINRCNVVNPEHKISVVKRLSSQTILLLLNFYIVITTSWKPLDMEIDGLPMDPK